MERNEPRHLIQLTVSFLSVRTLKQSAIITCCELKSIHFHLQNLLYGYIDIRIGETERYSHLINSPKQSKHRNNPQRVLYVIAFCHIFFPLCLSVALFCFALISSVFSFAIITSIHFRVQLLRVDFRHSERAKRSHS